MLFAVFVVNGEAAWARAGEEPKRLLEIMGSEEGGRGCKGGMETGVSVRQGGMERRRDGETVER